MNARLCALALLLSTCPTVAYADRGDLGMGVLGTFEMPVGGRGGVAMEVGVGDAAAVRGEVTYGQNDHVNSTQVLVGPTLTWDVIAWVPAFTLAGGIQVDHGVRALGLARFEMRRYVDRVFWLSAGAAAELEADAVRGQVLLSAFWQPF